MDFEDVNFKSRFKAGVDGYIFSDCKHLCYMCQRVSEEDMSQTTIDDNACNYASVLNMLAKVGPGDSGNTRVLKDECSQPIFSTQDNGMGYWITRCPFFEFIHPDCYFNSKREVTS